MVGEGWDCCVGSKMVMATCFSVTGGAKVGMAAWPKSALFTPRFSKFGLIRKFHSISNLSITHCKYNEWLEKVEIGTHSLQPSPYSGFWVAGGDNYGRNPPTILTKIMCFGLIQESQSISTLPMSQYKYNEWSEEVEIVVWAVKWSPQRVF